MIMRYRWIGGLCVLIVLLAACGQKPGVHQAGSGQAAGLGGGGEASSGGTGPGGAGGTGGPGTVTGPGATVGPGATTGPGVVTGPGTSAGPGDTIGISATEIRIGLHAPISGAAPIEPKAFKIGTNLYWNWLKKKGIKVHGRDVRVFFRDDTYTPSGAVTACNDMATRDKVFMLIGAAGTDQINACGRYSNQNHIPYFSAGVQEAGVRNYSTYFALTMTYAQQMPLLAQYIKQLGDGEDRYSANGVPTADGTIKIAFVRPNTPNFDDAQAALQRAIATLGSKYKLIIKTVVKEGSQNEATTVATDLKGQGVDIISPITAPAFTVFLAGNTGSQQFRPRYMGVGITNGVNQGIAQECRNKEFDGAMFFSPWPGWSQRDTYDPEFEKAANADPDAPSVNSRNGGGDILLAIWGIMKTMHGVLDKLGANPTRSSLIQLMQGYQGRTGFFPDVAFSSSNHFGARNVHALVGSCDPSGGSGEFIEDPKHPGLRSSF
jgi:ABC-type branched-subunit amino acid transport system substrate-binding protein